MRVARHTETPLPTVAGSRAVERIWPRLRRSGGPSRRSRRGVRCIGAELGCGVPVAWGGLHRL
ncbi:hypothetical protein KCH_23190 [Kitasatospora cheerisanensis KCTC 2395]|uniref:Uncharacterized protein n=1 Tax=Kitasatospora cheerisanensis KCTC 2395 TaxID=1348663 RepID=A0A066YWJ7_9ACTN|nr:hypothetical protein KCH_23190 [Kitasatospora cheerisanensis KCTC 2395]